MQLTVHTNTSTEMIDITGQIQEILIAAGFNDGLCMLYVPHNTTAAVTINENADTRVAHDVIMALNRIVPWEADYRHAEGNSPAHVKASMVGASELISVENGRMVLGTWQGLFFCEFDGPRTRKLYIKLIPHS